MPFEIALFVAAFILIATVIGFGIFVGSRRLAAKEEELRRIASARGWQFESKLEKGTRVHRWTGSTDGVAWVAESVSNVSGRNTRDRQHNRRRHVARWHGNFSPGISGAIVAMGVARGKEERGRTIAEGSGFFAKLAQKATGFAFDRAIDVYFGQEPGQQVDAGAMHRVDAKTPGFIVMADSKEEGARVLQQGLERALVDAAADKNSVLSNDDRPWILLQPNAVRLARMERFRDVTELEAFVRAGITLTRMFKFGRLA